MKVAFDTFKTTHADIIANGASEVKESSATQPNTSDSSAVKKARQEGSLSARSDRSSSKPLNNSQIVKRRSSHLNGTSDSRRQVLAETGSERSITNTNEGKDPKVQSELDKKDEQIKQLMEQIEQLKKS